MPKPSMSLTLYHPLHPRAVSIFFLISGSFLNPILCLRSCLILINPLVFPLIWTKQLSSTAFFTPFSTPPALLLIQQMNLPAPLTIYPAFTLQRRVFLLLCLNSILVNQLDLMVLVRLSSRTAHLLFINLSITFSV